MHKDKTHRVAIVMIGAGNVGHAIMHVMANDQTVLVCHPDYDGVRTVSNDQTDIPTFDDFPIRERFDASDLESLIMDMKYEDEMLPQERSYTKNDKYLKKYPTHKGFKHKNKIFSQQKRFTQKIRL